MKLNHTLPLLQLVCLLLMLLSLYFQNDAFLIAASLCTLVSVVIGFCSAGRGK